MINQGARNSVSPSQSTKRIIFAGALCAVLLLILVGSAVFNNISRVREVAYGNANKLLTLDVIQDEVRVRSLLASIDNMAMMLRNKHQFNDHGISITNLNDYLKELEFLHASKIGVTVTNELGVLIASTEEKFSEKKHLNLADREYFKAQQSSDQDALQVGRPVVSRFDGQWLIPVTKRINKDDGSFGGLIIVAVDPVLFTGPPETSLIQPKVSRVLFGLDGYSRYMVLGGKTDYEKDVRKAQLYDEIKKNRTGAYLATAPYDGISRIVSYRVLDPYAVVLSAAVDTSVIDAVYASDKQRILMTGATLCSLIVALAGALIYALRRQQLALQSQAQLSQLIEQIPQLVTKLNLRGEIIWANQRTYEYLGVSESEERASFDWMLEAVHPDDLEKVKEFNTDAYQHAKVQDSIEYRKRRADGEYRWVSATVSMVADVNGKPQYFLTSVMDVHDQKVATENLQLGQKLESIGQLTGGMAHDFNNLLAIIIGNLDLLQSEVHTEKGAQRLSVAVSAAQRGVGLIKSLLAVASRQALLPCAVDLGAMVKRLGPLLGHASGKRISFVLSAPEESVNVVVDEAGLESVLLNLVVNARDAMPDGGTITLALEVSNGVACVSVKDTGTGMPPEVLKRATEPFFTTKEAGKGTGLGLSMVAGFAKQSGGTLNIQSTQGSGTTVQMCLPLVTQPNPTAKSVAVELASPVKKIGKRKVLIVDDEPAIAELAREWVKETGHTAVTAHSADDALTLLAIRPFDVLLSDIVMPGQSDGIALAEKAGALYPDLKIILMSGYSRETATNRQDLPWPLLVKPFQSAELIAALDRELVTSGLPP